MAGVDIVESEMDTYLLVAHNLWAVKVVEHEVPAEAGQQAHVDDKLAG